MNFVKTLAAFVGGLILVLVLMILMPIILGMGIALYSIFENLIFWGLGVVMTFGIIVLIYKTIFN